MHQNKYSLKISTRNGTCYEKKSKEQQDYLINKDVSEDNQIFGCMRAEHFYSLLSSSNDPVE